MKKEEKQKEETVEKIDKNEEKSVISKTDEEKSKGDKSMKKDETQNEESVEKI